MTPKALIGINKGVTVVEYDNIADIGIKVKHHSERVPTSKTYMRHRMSAGWRMLYSLSDQYKEWNTYYIVVKQKNIEGSY